MNKENVATFPHNKITATHFFKNKFPKEDSRIYNLLFKYNNDAISLMHSIPDNYDINIKSIDENILMSPTEININNILSINNALNDHNKNYEDIYMNSYMIQQGQYLNENIVNLREHYLSELSIEIRDEMNRLKQIKFTMKEFNAFNQQMKK